MVFSEPEKLDYLVFIGRFQVPHFGHFSVINSALEQANKLILCVGSANRARSIKNPMTYEERVDLFTHASTHEIREAIEQGRILFVPIDDYMYDDAAWVKHVQAQVYELAGKVNKFGLIGCGKDESSYYLDLFPFWPSIKVPSLENYNSTEIRGWWLDYGAACGRNTSIKSYTTSAIVDNLHGYSQTEWFKNLQIELTEISVYKNKWKAAPYPVKHVTVDNVVTCNDHILLVTRGKWPGKGNLALPGGHLDEYEKLQDGAIRELVEETKIDLEKKTIRAWIKDSHTFDSPGRSMLGRVITTAFHIPLLCTDFPAIQAADDAADARWYKISELDPKQFHDDHAFIIQHFVKNTYGA